MILERSSHTISDKSYRFTEAVTGVKSSCGTTEPCGMKLPGMGPSASPPESNAWLNACARLKQMLSPVLTMSFIGLVLLLRMGSGGGIRSRRMLDTCEAESLLLRKLFSHSVAGCSSFDSFFFPLLLSLEEVKSLSLSASSMSA